MPFVSQVISFYFPIIYFYPAVEMVVGFRLQHGYAVIDLKILCPLKIEDICLIKFLSLLLQVLLIIYMTLFLLNFYFYVNTLVIVV